MQCTSQPQLSAKDVRQIMGMSGNHPLRCEKTVLESTDRGVILEIRFEGGDSVARGHKMTKFIQNAIEEHRPAAIILNLLGIQAIFDTDVGGMVSAFRDRQREINLPCIIAIRGVAARSLASLLTITKMMEIFDIVIVDGMDEALKQARQAVSGDIGD